MTEMTEYRNWCVPEEQVHIYLVSNVALPGGVEL